MLKSILKSFCKTVGLNRSSDCQSDSRPSSVNEFDDALSTKRSMLIRKAEKTTMPQKHSNEAEPDIFTLSSDEDEDTTPTSMSNKYSNFTSEECFSNDQNQPWPLNEKEPTIPLNFNNNIYLRRPVNNYGKYLEGHNSNNYIEFESLPCNSLRIGSYKVVPTDKVIIDRHGIQITVGPFAYGEKDPITLEISVKKILKVLAHFGASKESCQVIFLYLTPCLADEIRSKLKMFDRNCYYFDPLSLEESQKRITLLPDKIKADVVYKIKDILNFELIDMTKKVKVYDLLEDLSWKEANEILIRSSPSEVDISKNITTFETATLFIYPPPPNRGGITITTDDYSCLKEEQFLNDVLIDFYLKWLHFQQLSSEDKNRTYILSSFFYKRLTAKPKKTQRSHPVEDNPGLTQAHKRHDRVKSWTKNVDIFEKDFILIPINERSHWFLAVICFPGLSGPIRFSDGQHIPCEEKTKPSRKSARMRKKCVMIPLDDDEDEFSDRDEAEGDDAELEEYEEEPINEEPPSKKLKSTKCPIKQPCILIFDSLSTRSRSKIVATLREYLEVEYRIKKFEERKFNKLTMPGALPKVPQQMNYHDCGIFTLQFAECIFKSPITDFTLPIQTLANWFSQDVMAKKREQIAKLIQDLVHNYNPSKVACLPPMQFATCENVSSLLVPTSNEEDDVDSNVTTFCAKNDLHQSPQAPIRKKISINLVSKTISNNVGTEPEPRSEIGYSPEISISSTLNLSEGMLDSAFIENGCDNSSFNPSETDIYDNLTPPRIDHSDSPTHLNSCDSQEQVNALIKNVTPKYDKPDYLKRLQKLDSRQSLSSNYGLSLIHDSYGNDSSDDEIFISKKDKKPISNNCNSPSGRLKSSVSRVRNSDVCKDVVMEIEMCVDNSVSEF